MCVRRRTPTKVAEPSGACMRMCIDLEYVMPMRANALHTHTYAHVSADRIYLLLSTPRYSWGEQQQRI